MRPSKSLSLQMASIAAGDADWSQGTHLSRVVGFP